MKKHIFLFGFLMSVFCLNAQEKMYLHLAGKTTLGAPVTSTDSVYFSNDGTTAFFKILGTEYSFPVSEIDSITFGADSQTIDVIFEEETVRIINPLAFEGVAVNAVGAKVTVNATTSVQDINFRLSGSTSDGMFKTYTAKRYNLILDGVSITNPEGPPLNLQSKKKTTIFLADGTTNTLTDGSQYAPAPNGEDQKATLFSEAKLIFKGSGSLIVNGLGNAQHGIRSDDEIEIEDGTITVSSAVLDGIHGKDGFFMKGGTVQITATGDGIDADGGIMEISGGNISMQLASAGVKGLSADSTIMISGGTINITMNGNQSKGIKGDQDILLSGGQITIHTTGDAVLEPSGSGFDPSYCTAIKAEGNVNLSGTELTITSSGKAGKGISADADIVMTGGTVNVTSTGIGAVYTNPSGQADAYVATCLTADNDIKLLGGQLTTSSSGKAGKGVSADRHILIGTAETSPTIQITTTGARLLVSGSGSNANYAEAKAMKADVDVIIENGNITISSSDDGIKAENSITINNCVLDILNSVEGVEAPFITFNGGNIHIKSSDDCINATFGFGGEGNDGSLATFNDGYIVVNTTGGDGIDSNGNVLITGGTIIVHGPPYSPEVGLDYNGTCNVNGGFLVISGTNSFMTQAPSNTSAQYSLKITFYQQLSSSTLFHIQNAAGEDMLTFQPKRNYYSIVFSSDMVVPGTGYAIYTGGSHSGTVTDGLYSGGTYSGGTLRKTFNVSAKVTNVSF